MAKITVELPDHLVEEFLGWMSNQGEQEFMDAYNNKPRDTSWVEFDYPGWKDKIVITEHEEERYGFRINR